MTRPILGVDYHAAATHAPGVGRYGRELVRAWVRLDAAPVGLELFEVGGRDARLPDAMLGLVGADVREQPLVHRRLRIPRRLTDALSRCVGVERLLGGCDVFLRSRPLAPATRRAASLYAVAQWPASGDAGSDARFRAELAANDHLIVFARAAADRLRDEFGVERERVHTTPVGADHWLRDAEPLEDAPGPRTLLVLGAVERRRRPEVVLEAFERLRETGALERLVFVGRRGPGAEDFVQRLGFSSARSAVEWIDAPVERDLPDIVRRAAVLVHVAEGEATAVTPLEALAFGVPAVVADSPEMREVLGDAVTYPEPSTDRRRGEALAAAIARALADDGPSARAERRALVAPYTGGATAPATAAVVERIAERVRADDEHG